MKWIERFEESVQKLAGFQACWIDRYMLKKVLQEGFVSSGGIEKYLGVVGWLVEDFAGLVGGIWGEEVSTFDCFLRTDFDVSQQRFMESVMQEYLVHVYEELATHTAKVVHELAVANIANKCHDSKQWSPLLPITLFTSLHHLLKDPTSVYLPRHHALQNNTHTFGNAFEFLVHAVAGEDGGAKRRLASELRRYVNVLGGAPPRGKVGGGGSGGGSGIALIMKEILSTLDDKRD
ncbi:hypothetical protein HDU98_006224 [Podochytrium sp. JEL0797]|nr:hypothetical protein HDU98_006224 [Podochytrium sp. JEL0797]